MRKPILISYLLFFCLLCQSPAAQEKPTSTRALSLRVLQERLSRCSPKGNCSQDLLQLAGLTEIDGYVLDEANSDLVLFGQVEPQAPPLHTENLVVAMRNAWLQYVEWQGNTYYYSDPGCSIDPDPEVMRRLQDIGDEIFSHSSPEEVERDIDRWHNICRKPQNVRVMGIPYDTRFGKIMVDADYYMKRLVDGSVSLGLEGFTSLTDMTLNRIKADIQANRPISLSLSFMNRFEFCPGANRYLYDDGVVLIDRCPVILLTEEEYLSESEGISGTGRADPLAGKFAQDFSQHYSEIAGLESIYLELEGLFRFVALAKIMKERQVDRQADLDYLLSSADVSEVKVDRTLQGISHTKQFKHHRDHPHGTETLQLWLPSCGGVTIKIRVDQEQFSPDTTGRLRGLRDRVLESRASPASLSWEFHTH